MTMVNTVTNEGAYSVNEVFTTTRMVLPDEAVTMMAKEKKTVRVMLTMMTANTVTNEGAYIVNKRFARTMRVQPDKAAMMTAKEKKTVRVMLRMTTANKVTNKGAYSVNYLFASEHLGLCMLGGEHALCELVRAAKGHALGNDAYNKDQDFVLISSKSEGDNHILMELRIGMNPISRFEQEDKIAFEDKNQVQHRWWLPKPNRTDCLVHFVKKCLANGSNPMEILHSSAKASSSSSKEE
jgi:hypothetical protein